MKKFNLHLVIGLVALLSIVTACSTEPKNNLIGTWKALDVQADFDEQRFTPEMLEQVIQMEKQVYFKFLNDSILNINTLDNTNKAYWYYDDETDIISFRFTDPGSVINELGVYEDGKIVAESQTALGKLTIIYVKEK